jgi:hypothetical protein
MALTLKWSNCFNIKKRKEGRGRKMMSGQTNNIDGNCIQEK